LSCYDYAKAKHEATIANAGKVCEHCGKIPFADQENQTKHAINALALFREPPPVTLTPLPVEPIYEPIPAIEPPTIDRAALLAEIQAGQSARATIDAKQEQLAAINAELEALQAIVYTISETIDAEISTASAELETLRTQHTTLKAELATLTAQAEAISDQIKQAQEHAAQIESTRAQVVTLTDTLGRWKYIASRMKKVAAMELELVIEDIDREATAILAPYRDGRYTFNTRTQRMGAADVVDEFDIMIHDNETGIERSFASHSVGEKAFLSDPYTKALIKIRNQRSHIAYYPLVVDEADSAIDIPSIPVYYAIQDAYYQDERVIVISHTPDAMNYIGNHIQARDLIRREA
jgi:DNA repair exonuclease SbcCD ATPase subunit